ncbi:hypothetical protein EXIGLDRAFT_654665 [Exidia glandulosa HHB12029]|uniref:Adenylyltransferase AadA C-terminal domain-containing protein n=1 Tax=Exidia glandulosa HHB12029 TaxID=1314781 RepID=A0A165DKE3_EXIGL|nr:hypothetical protein EXIGLDRAFT_654665 [Exidia glandulosa HHB12029]
MDDLNLPSAEREYLASVVNALHDICGDELLGVFLVGSASYGAYQAGISDIDVQAVASDTITEASILTIASRLSHSQIPCPARLLEFVLYTKSAARALTEQPRWSLNLNTGAQRGKDTVQLEPDPDAGQHWFLLDLACARELGRTLYGSEDTAQVFAAPERAWVLNALHQCVLWFVEHDPNNTSAVLNACRAWRWSVDQVWGSKLQGAKWAAKRPDLAPEYLEIVKVAMETRLSSADQVLSIPGAKAFLGLVADAIARSNET